MKHKNNNKFNNQNNNPNKKFSIIFSKSKQLKLLHKNN